MSDLYHSLATSNLGRKILSGLNLPTPVALERWKQGQEPFIQGTVILSAAENGTLINEAEQILKDCELIIQTSSPSTTEDDLNKYQRSKALVFDASGISNTQQLTQLHTFFHPLVRSVKSNGRIILLGKPPEDCQQSSQASAQRSLEGFTRSLSKELGKKGITTQLIYVEEGAQKQLASPLRFCLSPKSAFVSAQVIRVGKAEGEDSTSDFDWNLPLKGKVALVTGASRGIGEAIAETLVRDGATIIGLDVPQAQSELEAVMKRLNGHALMCDITSETAPDEINLYLKEKFSGVDIVVHNAGITRDKTLGGMAEHLWNLVIDINLSAMERINAKLLDSHTINPNGRIVAVSSMSGIAGNFGQTNYAVSKAGVIGYVESMAATLSEQGITINAVAPGFIETQMTAAIPFTIREAGRRFNALSQGGLPVDVAETIAFFASGASKGINGNTIRVCGQNLLGA